MMIQKNESTIKEKLKPKTHGKTQPLGGFALRCLAFATYPSPVDMMMQLMSVSDSTVSFTSTQKATKGERHPASFTSLRSEVSDMQYFHKSKNHSFKYDAQHSMFLELFGDPGRQERWVKHKFQHEYTFSLLSIVIYTQARLIYKALNIFLY